MEAKARWEEVGHGAVGGVPLTALKPGDRATVVALEGGRGFNQRLAAVGILPDSELTLIRGGTHGPVIVEVRGSRMILGHGAAHRVLVAPLKGPASH